eukprot:Hpha_TRINITY_DN14439_c2_g1::TRINITY_DN14439_c2_g1_i4::g.157663::m.157663/K17686/copA, ATP7; Cu+-exporting ATPase
MPTRQQKVGNFTVEGMTCKSCEARIKRMLRPRKVQIAWQAGTLSVHMQDGESEDVVLAPVNAVEKFTAQLVSWEQVEVEYEEEQKEAPRAEAPPPAATTQTGVYHDTTLLVKDMTCASCAARIEDHLSDHPLIVTAVVNFSTCTARVRHSDEMSPTTVAGEVTSLGYRSTVMGEGSRAGDEFRRSLTREDDINEAWNAASKSLGLAIPLIIIFLILARNKSFRECVLHLHIVNGVTLGPLIQVLLATPVVFKWGRPFFSRAYSAVSHRTFTMDVLVSLGVASAFFASALTLMEAFSDRSGIPKHRDYHFHTAAMLIAFMLLGKYLEARAKSKTAEALLGLLDLQPSTALRVRGGLVEEVSVEAIVKGDMIRIVAGARVPVDGEVVDGHVSVDQSMLTGESVPVNKRQGDVAAGGTLCVDGGGTLKAIHDASDSTPAQIFRLVNEAQMSKAPVQKYADKAAGVFVPVVVIFAALVFIVWMILGLADAYPKDWRDVSGQDAGVFVFSAKFMITTLVIACPCAMGLATPTAVMVGTGVGAQHGVFIKGGEALEVASGAERILFDKTGTLTAGKLSVQQEVPLHSTLSHDDCLRLAAAVEAMSSHPIAKAVIARWEERLGAGEAAAPPAVTDVVSTPGRGLSAMVEGRRVSVGSPNWVQRKEGDIVEARKMAEQGLTVVMVIIDNEPALCLGLNDTLKPEARCVVDYLRNKHRCEVYMVTGDQPTAAYAVGSRCNIPPANIFAGVLPAEKAAIVNRLQRRKRFSHDFGDRVGPSGLESPLRKSELTPVAHGDGVDEEMGIMRPRLSEDSVGLLEGEEERGVRVVFIGDGINDAPALAAADVGVALGAGTSIAIDAADAVLARSDLRDVITLLHLSRVTLRRIRYNFAWAVGYNFVALPLASGMLMPLMDGMQMPPVVGGAAMVMSSLCVLASSLALKLYNPPELMPLPCRV